MRYDELAYEIGEMSILDKLKCNKSAAEIHISLLAEAMWDAMNESTPKNLKPTEWHIPELPGHPIDSHDELTRAKISAAHMAKISYNNHGSGIDYEKDMDLFNSLVTRPYTTLKGVYIGEDEPIHASPTEHCAQAMNIMDSVHEPFSGNFKGFIQLRKTLPNENKV